MEVLGCSLSAASAVYLGQIGTPAVGVLRDSLRMLSESRLEAKGERVGPADGLPP